MQQYSWNYDDILFSNDRAYFERLETETDYDYRSKNKKYFGLSNELENGNYALVGRWHRFKPTTKVFSVLLGLPATFELGTTQVWKNAQLSPLLPAEKYLTFL